MQHSALHLFILFIYGFSMSSNAIVSTKASNTFLFFHSDLIGPEISSYTFQYVEELQKKLGITDKKIVIKGMSKKAENNMENQHVLTYGAI